MEHSQQSQITSFLSKYSITPLNSQTLLLKSSSGCYLSKQITLDSTQTDIDTVIDTLQQHQTLSPTYLLTLLSYNVTPISNSSINTVRTLYQYAEVDLQSEIERRKSTNQYFEEAQIWTIIYAVTKSLQYLEKMKIGYGVLGCDKIFIDKRITLIDPSVIAEDPLTLAPNRLYSPQVIHGHASIDIIKSDVYVLGLCLLQVVLLISVSSASMPKYDETKLSLYLQQVQSSYNPQLACLIRQMLQYSPQDRPSFAEIREYLQNTLELSQPNDQYFNPLPPDSQDSQNVLQTVENIQEEQCCDVEEEDERNSSIASLNQYEKAKLKFLNQSQSNVFKDLSPINQSSRYSSSMRIGTHASGDKRKTSKSIKEKVVKKMDQLDLELVEVKDYRRSKELSKYDLNAQNNLFTNPKLLEEIKRELKNIAHNRSQQGLKENYHSCNH